MRSKSAQRVGMQPFSLCIQVIMIESRGRHRPTNRAVVSAMVPPENLLHKKYRKFHLVVLYSALRKSGLLEVSIVSVDDIAEDAATAQKLRSQVLSKLILYSTVLFAQMHLKMQRFT